MDEPLNLSVAPTATMAGDSRSSAMADFYFSAPFSVGSGAKASSDQAGAGASSDWKTYAALAAVGLVALVVVVRILNK